jgi:hypothetical protein
VVIIENSIFNNTKEKVMDMINNLDTKKIVSDISDKVTHTIDNINELYIEKTTPKSYRLVEGKSIYGLTNQIYTFLKETKKMDTQVLKLEDGNVIIQSRTEYGNVKQFVGLDKAVTVKINNNKKDMLDVQIGESKWIDKGLTLTASFFTVWPLAVSSGIGIYLQLTLNNELNQVIIDYFDI